MTSLSTTHQRTRVGGGRPHHHVTRAPFVPNWPPRFRPAPGFGSSLGGMFKRLVGVSSKRRSV